MVFIGRVVFGVWWRKGGNPGPHRAWSRRRILRLSAHYYGRRNNCYTIAIRNVYRALHRSKIGRHQKKLDAIELWQTRLDAACCELGLRWPELKRELDVAGVGLDRNVLQMLAAHEPRTFRSLVSLAKSLNPDPGLNSLEGPPPGAVTRSML